MCTRVEEPAFQDEKRKNIDQSNNPTCNIIFFIFAPFIWFLRGWCIAEEVICCCCYPLLFSSPGTCRSESHFTPSPSDDLAGLLLKYWGGGIARTVYHTPTGCKGFFLFCRVTQIKKRNCKTQIMIKTICHTQKELTFWKDIASNIAMNWFCVCIDA